MESMLHHNILHEPNTTSNGCGLGASLQTRITAHSLYTEHDDNLTCRSRIVCLHTHTHSLSLSLSHTHTHTHTLTHSPSMCFRVCVFTTSIGSDSSPIPTHSLLHQLRYTLTPFDSFIHSVIVRRLSRHRRVQRELQWETSSHATTTATPGTSTTTSATVHTIQSGGVCRAVQPVSEQV